MSSNTIFNAYSNFTASSVKGNKLIVRSVMHKFLAESWGGQAPQKSKATYVEVSNFIELIKTLPSTNLISSTELLEQKFIEKGTNKDNSKSYRSAYKTFINWAESNNYFLASVKEAKPVNKINLFNRNAKGVGERAKVTHNLQRNDTYILMARCNVRGENLGKLIYPNDYINDDLLNDLKLFEKFRKDQGLTPATIKRDMGVIHRILGWLHRFKNIPLEKLRLTSIIQFMKLNVKLSDFKDNSNKINYEEYIYCKAMTRQNAVDLANENRNLIKEYADFVGRHPGTKVLAITSCIAVAKFVFRSEIGTDDYIDDSDLAIVRRLNQLCNTLNKIAKDTPPSVLHSAKSIPWIEAINVLQTTRLKTDCLIIEKERNLRDKSGNFVHRITKVKRSISAVNNDLQDFLSLALMLLIPTDRARTYYELEIGRTFVCGLLEHNKFTPVDKLQDKTQATWYIHLMPGDYKTGKIYKEYWGMIPNVEFEDGKKLYEYINRWINEAREHSQKCIHNLFFRRSGNYNPFLSKTFSNHIRTLFEAETGVPVTPKEIRKMYITYLNNSGASSTELKGAAYAMHHSQKMQESVYNSQTILDRIAPIMDFNERMWKDATTKPASKELSLV